MLVYLQTSAAFAPYESHIGAEGTICGIIGVIFVELIQFWPLVRYPKKELTKLCFMIGILLFVGALPFHSIFGMVAGLTMGMLCGIVLLPYITFKAWSMTTRIILLLMAIPTMLVMFIFILYSLIEVQSLENCEICKLVDCIPIYGDKCENQELFE